MKFCKKCDSFKSKRKFHKDSSRSDKLSFYCKECTAVSARKVREAWNKEHQIPDLMECIKCRETKPNADFSKDASRPKGLRPECKKCRSASNSSSYRNTHEGWCKVVFSLARKRAADKGLPFALTSDDIVIPATCPVLGIPLNKGTGRRHDGSPTLDRINNDLGYVKGNVLVISWRANRIKSDSTLDELKSLVAYLENQCHAG